MTQGRARFGLTLPNRGVIIGATTVEEMLKMGEWADSAGWDSVWVGDSIFAKPRLDAIVLLGALAARTKRVRLGPACFASTPLRDALIQAGAIRLRPILMTTFALIAGMLPVALGRGEGAQFRASLGIAVWLWPELRYKPALRLRRYGCCMAARARIDG